MSSKKRRAWSSFDVQKLRSMARRKAGADSIARRLRRTQNATRQKAFAIGVSLETRAGVLAA